MHWPSLVELTGDYNTGGGWGGGRGGALPASFFPPVQQTTSVIGLRVK